MPPLNRLLRVFRKWVDKIVETRKVESPNEFKAYLEIVGTVALKDVSKPPKASEAEIVRNIGIFVGIGCKLLSPDIFAQMDPVHMDCFAGILEAYLDHMVSDRVQRAAAVASMIDYRMEYIDSIVKLAMDADAHRFAIRLVGLIVYESDDDRLGKLLDRGVVECCMMYVTKAVSLVLADDPSEQKQQARFLPALRDALNTLYNCVSDDENGKRFIQHMIDRGYFALLDQVVARCKWQDMQLVLSSELSMLAFNISAAKPTKEVVDQVLSAWPEMVNLLVRRPDEHLERSVVALHNLYSISPDNVSISIRKSDQVGRLSEFVAAAGFPAPYEEMMDHVVFAGLEEAESGVADAAMDFSDIPTPLVSAIMSSLGSQVEQVD